MNPQTYYATPEDMLAKINGSIGVSWLEVKIIGIQNTTDGSKCVLVETLDGSQRFTSRNEHLFIKTLKEDNTSGSNN